MSQSPYAQPFDDFVDRTRVAVDDQVELQPLPDATTDLDWGDGHLPPGDGSPGPDGD